MLLKAAFLGFMALGISGHGASAATFAIENFNLLLRYEGTSFSNLSRYPTGSIDDDGYSIPEVVGEDEFGIGEYKHLSVGDIVSLVTTISYPVPDPVVPGGSSNGGSAPVCNLGGRDCTNMNYAIREPDIFVIAEGDQDILSVRLAPGDDVLHSFWGVRGITNDFGHFMFDGQNAVFTVLENIPVPAPIPLPAGILLLPAAIAGFGVLRRRKAVSPR